MHSAFHHNFRELVQVTLMTELVPLCVPTIAVPCVFHPSVISLNYACPDVQ